MSGKTWPVLKIAGDDFPVLKLADSKVVQIGDPIHIMRYPGVVLSHELLNQSVAVEASVTNGAVSGFQKDKNNHPVIQTGCLSRLGQLGRAGVDDRGTVLGVLTFVSLAPGPRAASSRGSTSSSPPTQ